MADDRAEFDRQANSQPAARGGGARPRWSDENSEFDTDSLITESMASRGFIDDDDTTETTETTETTDTHQTREGYDSSYDDYLDEEEDEDDGGTYELPPHSCRYCHVSDPLSVAKCNVCKKWFCNSRMNTAGSHLVTHLVRAKHKEVSLHPDGPLGDSTLECFVCGSKNVFLLGFVPSKQESVVVLLCREPCLNSTVLRDMDWDPSSWLPLIEDRQLLTWLAQAPNGEERAKRRGFRHTRSISNKQMIKLEDTWKTNPDADLDDVMRNTADFMELEPVPASFKDGLQYVDAWMPLVDAEAAQSKELKESICHENITVRWEVGLGRKKIAIFELPISDKLTTGDELIIMHPATKYEDHATIVRMVMSPSTTDEIHCEVRGMMEPPHGPSSAATGNADDAAASATGYKITFLWKSISFDRARRAMVTMAKDETSLSAYLYNRLLGQVTDESAPKNAVAPPNKVTAPNLPDLNLSQTNAIKTVLQRNLSLIQGPPGTGKTVTSATLIYHICTLNNAQVLVCAPSNVAVDQLAERIASTGLNVVRVAAKTRESVASSIDHLMLHRQVRDFADSSPKQSELKKLLTLRDELGRLSERDTRRFVTLMNKVEMAIIQAADVICCTCTGAADKRLAKFRFKYVLVDEATQAQEPECLIPMVMGAKQLILVGDHCQMGPVTMHRKADAAGLGRSLFERLVQLGERPIRLDIQYRMHPCLSEFSSNQFYDGTLQNGVTAEERDAAGIFPWPNPRTPMFFYNSIAPEELGPSGTSYLNRAEAALAEKVVTHLMKNGIMPDRIGVITPYEAQRSYLVNYMLRNGQMPQDAYKLLEIASVDSFQGREKEFVVLTCVRSNDHQGLGFLTDWRRLNVALTRARRGLVVIGNARVLSRHLLWNTFLEHFKNQELIVDGPLMNLKSINVALQKPRQTGFTIGPWQPPLASLLQSHPAYAEPMMMEVPVPEVDYSYVPGQLQQTFNTDGRPRSPVSQASMSMNTVDQ